MRLIAALSFAPVLCGQIHQTPVAGRWFPAAPLQLNQVLDRSLATSLRRTGDVPPRKRLLALVVPHAGLDYSGAVAAAAYRLASKPRSVILLGFSHRASLNGVVVPRVPGFSTPLGEVSVNQALAAELGFPAVEERRVCDHSLENQLPFLRRWFPGVPIVPLYVGDLDGPQLAAAARTLAARLGLGDLLIASSDFTHYGEAYQHVPFPKDDRILKRLHERAIEALEHVGSLSVQAFDDYLLRTGDTICGRGPIRLLMSALASLRHDVYMTQADLMTSGELTGDYSLSVTYAALAFYPAEAFSVEAPLQRRLLTHSRSALEAHLGGSPQLPDLADSSPELAQRTGVFVTLRKLGELRGCVGSLSPRASLVQTVAERTLAAAVSDPRFPRLSRAEGPVAIEVSLLTPLKRLHDWRRFRAGWGGVLSLNGRGGLLLPQVASEMGWSEAQFLEGLSRKAGLPVNAYRHPDAKLYVFGAQVFAE
jgi:AmmeMemoRadiSam system protein B/AmmeMemoRadiSam system protein A